jgi:DNA polymerase I
MSVKVRLVTDRDEAVRVVEDVAASDELIALDFETMASVGTKQRIAVIMHVRTDLQQAQTELKARRRQIRARTADGAAHLTKANTELAIVKDELLALEVELKHVTKRAPLSPHTGEIRLCSLYAGGDEALVIDIMKTGPDPLRALDGASLVIHNAPFDLAFLEHVGVYPSEIHDTMQMTRLLLGAGRRGQESVYSLGLAAKTLCGVDLDKRHQNSDWSEEPLGFERIVYAAQDAVACWRLAETAPTRLTAQKSTEAYEIQAGAIPAITRMTLRGVGFDVEAHDKMIGEWRQEQAAAAQEFLGACRGAGGDTLTRLANANLLPKANDTQVALRAVLTEKELAGWPRTEKSGALSTAYADLRRGVHHPVIAALARNARVRQLLTTFGPTFQRHILPSTDRVHGGTVIAGAATGRATGGHPNLRAAPRDNEKFQFRALLKAAPGRMLVAADYGSMELRAAAEISGDDAMRAAFRDGVDLHLVTAATMTGKRLGEVTDEERTNAKCVNFGVMYGMGAEALTKYAWKNYGLVIEVDTAKQWLWQWDDKYAGYIAWRQRHYERCEREGKVVIGRNAPLGEGRVYRWEWSETYGRDPRSDGEYDHDDDLDADDEPLRASWTKSAAYPVQGVCADIGLVAIALIEERLIAAGVMGECGLVGWIHDEFLVEVEEHDVAVAKRILEESMVRAFLWAFPDAPTRGLVKAKAGRTWAETKKKAPAAPEEEAFTPVEAKS